MGLNSMGSAYAKPNSGITQIYRTANILFRADGISEEGISLMSVNLNAEASETVTSLPAFLELVEKYRKAWFAKEKTWGPWFRGQTSDWPLRPSLYRYSPRIRQIRIIEDEIRQEFAVRAPSLGTERPDDPWDWYFLMQHCGAPNAAIGLD
jgi:hypothetical protein